MEAEIDLAMTDWEEIPTAYIPEICAEARKQSGDFMPGNGSVAALWREMRAELRRPKSEPFKALPAVKRTPEEIKQIEDMCKGVREFLK